MHVVTNDVIMVLLALVALLAPICFLIKGIRAINDFCTAHSTGLEKHRDSDSHCSCPEANRRAMEERKNTEDMSKSKEQV